MVPEIKNLWYQNARIRIRFPASYVGVSKNRGTPKWMVKIMVPNPIKMDDLGVPLFLETLCSRD